MWISANADTLGRSTQLFVVTNIRRYKHSSLQTFVVTDNILTR